MRFTKPTTEQKRKELAGGHYLLMERKVKTEKATGRVFASGWTVVYDSRTGY